VYPRDAATGARRYDGRSMGRRGSRMTRLGFGLTNVYLRCGVVMLLVAVASAVLLFGFGPWQGTPRLLLGWALRAGLLGGVVLYVIGRLVQGAGVLSRRAERRDPR